MPSDSVQLEQIFAQASEQIQSHVTRTNQD